MGSISNLFTGFVAVEATNAVAEKVGNQITFENFIVQAKNLKILKIKLNTNTENTCNKLQLNDINVKKDAYLELYDCLIEKNIITSKLGLATLFTWWTVYTVNNKLTNIDNIKNLLKNINYPLLKCYSIDYEKLSKFLKSYTHNTMNRINIFNGNKSKSKGKSKNNTKKNNKIIIKK
jgi:hypothetical protein